MAEITQEVNIEILEKLSDGTYKKKNPATKAGVVKFEDGSTVEDHKSDYVLQVPYGVATGLANTYTITLNPAPTSYKEGMAVAIKINTTNTGASTININGLGAKSVRKANGNNVSAGNLKAGSIYSMRYNGTNFILQGSDSAGNATPGDVLSGKTFSNGEDTDLVGTMPSRTGHVTAQGFSQSGTTLRFRPGISAKLFTALGNRNINIRMINQGSSEINIIVAVEDKDFEEAIRAIYDAFIK